MVILLADDRTEAFDLASLGPVPVPILVRSSKITTQQLETARSRLERLPEQVSAGHSLAFHFDAGKQKLMVTTTIVEAELARLLGDSWNIISYRGGKVLPAAAGFRMGDVAPYWGGAGIRWAGSTDYYDCTTGFTVVNGAGRRGMVVPAHCGPVLADVLVPATGAKVGTTEKKSCGPGYNNDVQLVAGQTYDNKIYVGTSSGSRADVTGAGDAFYGQYLRFSGAASAEKSGQLVVDTDGQWWVTTGWCNTSRIGYFISPSSRDRASVMCAEETPERRSIRNTRLLTHQRYPSAAWS